MTKDSLLIIIHIVEFFFFFFCNKQFSCIICLLCFDGLITVINSEGTGAGFWEWCPVDICDFCWRGSYKFSNTGGFLKNAEYLGRWNVIICVCMFVAANWSHACFFFNCDAIFFTGFKSRRCIKGLWITPGKVIPLCWVENFVWLLVNLWWKVQTVPSNFWGHVTRVSGRGCKSTCCIFECPSEGYLSFPVKLILLRMRMY